jgi:hypothetical protein
MAIFLDNRIFFSLVLNDTFCIVYNIAMNMDLLFTAILELSR